MSAVRKQQNTNTPNNPLGDAFRRINYVPAAASTQAPSVNGTTNGNGNGNGSGNGQPTEDGLANYSLQGVMQWLNGEYRRYERDRNNWEIERASLHAQVSHLIGTKAGNQKVHEDLIRQNRILERRIKALEQALKAERAKNSAQDVPCEQKEANSSPPPPQNPIENHITPLLTNPDRQRSRKLLESCLREINYLLSPPSIPIDKASQSQDWPNNDSNHALQQARPEPASSEEITYVPVDNETRPQEEDELPRKVPKKVSLLAPPPTEPLSLPPKKEEITWDFAPHENKTTILERSQASRPSVRTTSFTNKTPDNPKQFRQIHTLKSHLAPVRALIPINSSNALLDETCFASAGDDSLIKFWRVSKTSNATNVLKKKGNFDILPQVTYRGHSGIITCLAESLGNIWSGGTDGGIRGWRLPSQSRDAYGSSVDATATLVLEGHTNCIWSLSCPGTQQPLLASAAADGTVKIWDTRLHSRSPLRASFKYGDKGERVNPTCVMWDWEGRGIVIGWENASVELWDVEKGVASMKLIHDSSDTGKTAQVNCFVKHPTENLVIAGYEDRTIRIFDTITGDCINSWAAHLDSISSLAVSPDGSTLLSGAHDSNVRFWDMNDKSCLQEALPPHRQRGDEGVLAVAWGDDEVAGSAGADGVVKLYVEQ